MRILVNVKRIGKRTDVNNSANYTEGYNIFFQCYVKPLWDKFQIAAPATPQVKKKQQKGNNDSTYYPHFPKIKLSKNNENFNNRHL